MNNYDGNKESILDSPVRRKRSITKENHKGGKMNQRRHSVSVNMSAISSLYIKYSSDFCQEDQQTTMTLNVLILSLLEKPNIEHDQSILDLITVKQ